MTRPATPRPLGRVRHAGACGAALAALLASLTGTPGAAFAQAAGGLGQMHGFKAWYVACDNTRACEAQGYGGNEPATAVLVVQRAAGPGAPARWRIGFADDPGPVPTGPVALSVGALRLTLPAPDPRSGFVDLAADAASQLRPWLLRADEIRMAAAGREWAVSLAGATAALLKMDDLQGRVGTPGALARPGTRPESAVPPPVPVPTFRAPALPAQRPADKALLRAIHRKIRPDPDNCPRLAEPETLERGEVVRLDERRVLVVFDCWLAAYNAGSGAWVASDRPPHAPVPARFQQPGPSPQDEVERPTFLSLEVRAGAALAAHSSAKGRGLGDCVSVGEWLWDGQRFALVEASVSPCQGYTGGGLPMRLWRAEAR